MVIVRVELSPSRGPARGSRDPQCSSSCLTGFLQRERFFGYLRLAPRLTVVRGAEIAAGSGTLTPMANLIGEVADLVPDLIPTRPKEDAGRDSSADRRSGRERVVSCATHDPAILISALGIVVAATFAFAAPTSASITCRHFSTNSS